MLGEAMAGFNAFKTMLDTAKALKDMNDAAIRNGAVIELQEQILAAQSEQAALVEQIHKFQGEVQRFNAWNTEKHRYELKDFGHNTFARTKGKCCGSGATTLYMPQLLSKGREVDSSIQLYKLGQSNGLEVCAV
jgi:hypothetical protein